MPSQYLTIAKIAGEASNETLRQFLAWNALRNCTDPNEWDPKQWPERTRLAADEWANRLRAHAHEPPVIFYTEYVDLWSSGFPQPQLNEHGLISIMANRFELSCLPLPLTAAARTDLERLSTDGQFDEYRWFARHTLDAADSWNKLVGQAVLVFLRLVVSGLVNDDELLESLKTVPGWMKSE